MIARHRDAFVAAALALCAVVALLLAVDAKAAGEYEINDTRETAAGPLTGGADYTATFETENDVDWFVFYLRAYSQVDIAATSAGSCGHPFLRLHDKDGKEIQSLHGGGLNVVEHMRITLPAGRYYLEIENHGCVGDGYKFRIDPAAALTPSRDCGEAIVSREAVGPELAKVSEKIGYVNAVVAKRTVRAREAKQRLKRLKAKRASRYSKRSARRKLTGARASLGTALEKKLALETLGAQYTASLNGANAQIAGSC